MRPEKINSEIVQVKPLKAEIKMVVQNNGKAFEEILNERLKEGWRIKELHFPPLAGISRSEIVYIAVLERLVKVED